MIQKVWMITQIVGTVIGLSACIGYGIWAWKICRDNNL